MRNPSTFEKRLATYGSMSLALAAVSAPQAAKAAVVGYFGPSVTDSAGSDIYFNLLTGKVDSTGPAAGDFELALSNAPEAPLARIAVYDEAAFHPGESRRGFALSMDFSVPSSSSAARLSPGDAVGSGLKFSTSGLLGTLAGAQLNQSGQPFGHFNNFNPISGDASGYLGLEILQNGTPEYGWADIVVHSDYSVTLMSFALQLSGTVLDAGAGTPEPSSVLLLALGAAGIALYRRKRKA